MHSFLLLLFPYQTCPHSVQMALGTKHRSSLVGAPSIALIKAQQQLYSLSWIIYFHIKGFKLSWCLTLRKQMIL